MPSPTSPSEAAAPPAATVRALLDKYGLRAKKSWGQNFLIDERAYRAIVAIAKIGPGDVAVEIGAGLGTLTARLLQTGARVIAVERDRDMAEVLRGELGAEPRFELREENALRLDLEALGREAGAPLVVVGNLPYNIASPLLFRFLGARAALRRLVLMFQREVAERLLAQPGADAYSAMAAQVQMLADVRRVCHVGSRGFLPPPRVDSTVVLVEPLPAPRVPVRDLRRYAQVVRAAFGQRRKTVRNALGAVFGPAAEAALRAAGVEPQRRGETLSLVEFARIADGLPADAPAPADEGEEAPLDA
jgi:16S rRNA (adenine1518-N6/adenine1519-N6)-dimethyltransferase